MNSFITKKIKTGCDLIAEELKRARTDNRVSLEQAAKTTGINIKYLKMLEAGNFVSLPAGLYGRNFLREYAGYLNLDQNEILQEFDKNADKDKCTEKISFTPKRVKNDFLLIAPKVFKNSLVLAVVTLCFLYLGYYVKNIVTPPKLSLNNPTENFITSDHDLKIAGATEPEAEVIINGEAVLSSPEGAFYKEISLKSGINSVSIMAKKKYSKENVITRQVLVRDN